MGNQTASRPRSGSRRTETKTLVDDATECGDAAVRDAREEGIAPRQVEAGIREAFADLIPFPALGTSAIVT